MESVRKDKTIFNKDMNRTKGIPNGIGEKLKLNVIGGNQRNH